MTQVPPGCPLTQVQYEVLQHLSEGMTYKQIAAEMNRATSTVRTHLYEIYGKFGVHDRGQAVIMCYRKGWLASDVGRSEAELEELRKLVKVMAILAKAALQRQPLTMEQHAYLNEMHHLLRAKSDDERTGHRLEMDKLISPMLASYGVGMERLSRPNRDLVQALLTYGKTRELV